MSFKTVPQMFQHVVSERPTLKTFYTKTENGWEGIDLAVTEKRMVRYNNLVNRNPYDYDTWFDMARLMESRNEIEKKT